MPKVHEAFHYFIALHNNNQGIISSTICLSNTSLPRTVQFFLVNFDARLKPLKPVVAKQREVRDKAPQYPKCTLYIAK
jgi:hypothetical protein